jgi:peptide/nickel transport system substrate-binding protein
MKASAIAASLLGTGHLSPKVFAEPIPVGTPEEGVEPQEGGEWIVGISELPDTLDPHKTGAAITSTILRNCGDTLIAKDFDGNYVPALATEWSVSEDGLTWTFKLRDDVTFHDGTKLDAEAVKANFDRILDPATASVTAGGNVGPMVSTAASDPTTFEFVLEEPFAPLLDNLTGATLAIVSPTAVESMGEDFGRTPVLSGPYIVEEYRSGDRVILRRNPDYRWAPEFLHQDGPAYIESIVFQSIIEDASRMAAFEAGEIQQTTLPAIDIERIVSSDQSWIVSFLRLGLVFLEFNIQKPPFDDVNVRRAINHAVNKEDVLGAAVENYGQVAHGFLSPSMFGYWEGITEYAPAYDVEQAKSLLADAGWEDTDGDGILEKEGAKFEFVALNLPTDSWNRAAQVVQSQLSEVGISMEIQQLEFATLLEEAKAGNHQAEFMGYTYTDPDIAYLWFHSSNAGTGLNMSHVNDPKLDELIMRGRSTMDIEERAAVYEELQQYLVDLSLWVPLWIDEYYVAYNRAIHEAKFHEDGYTVYFDAWLEQ